MLNQTAEYALRAVVHMAGLDPDVRVQASELARVLDVPANYLSKILHQLATNGVLESQRGRHGGFRLARPADRLTLEVVVRPFGAVAARNTCVLGQSVCSDRTACAAHERWKPIKEATNAFLRETTVAQLVPGAGQSRRRAAAGR